jgi:hypothetical protein
MFAGYEVSKFKGFLKNQGFRLHGFNISRNFVIEVSGFRSYK